MDRIVITLIATFFVGIVSSSASMSHTLDLEGSGYLWTGSDVGANHDRAGGYGNWMYGSMADAESLVSLYQFRGNDGFYRASNLGNISQDLQATNLTDFNASVFMNNATVETKINGTGRVKLVIGTTRTITGPATDSGTNILVHPVDLSRTYISGKFAIDNKHNVGAW